MEELAEPIGTRHHFFTAHDGGQMHAIEYGPSNAAPIVLLHGVTLAAALWNHALGDLGGEFRVIALDWRGHGRSRPGRDGYGVGVLAQDLATLLTHFDLRDAVVVGHSMGGMALGRFAIEHPAELSERVSGLVFCDTAAFDIGRGSPKVGRTMLAHLAGRSPERTGRLAQAAGGDLAYVGARVTFGEDPDPVAVEQARLFFDAMAPSAITKSILPLLAHDVREGLPSVTTPSLVLVGSKDVITPPSQADDLVRLLRNARLHIFDGAGHVPMLERRAEFAEVIGAFAREVQQAK